MGRKFFQNRAGRIKASVFLLLLVISIYNPPVCFGVGGNGLMIVGPSETYSISGLAAENKWPLLAIALALHPSGANETPGPGVEIPLHRAAANGNYMAVKLLVAFGADVNAEDKNGIRPFEEIMGAYRVSKSEKRRIGYYLINHGLEINPQKPDSLDKPNFPPFRIIPPLSVAARSGDMSIVKSLIERGAVLNPRGRIMTPLSAAVSTCNYEMAKYLLDSGADVSFPIRDGSPPITLINMCVDHNSFDSTLSLLLEHGAEINAPDGNNETLLHKLILDTGGGCTLSNYILTMFNKGATVSKSNPRYNNYLRKAAQCEYISELANATRE